MALAEVEILGCPGVSISLNSDNRTLGTGNKIIENEVSPLSGFELVPNPTSSSVVVFLEKYLGKTGDLVVFNQLGVQVFSQHFDKLEQPKIHLDLRKMGLKNGLFYVGILNAGRPVFKRLVMMDEN